ncbi:MAG: hypothetical protein E4G99_13545 [Anaerolineales bacterium]|nr:MAG: hypothetical protein E4G99_13545 [Anaerolineales bacterium]
MTEGGLQAAQSLYVKERWSMRAEGWYDYCWVWDGGGDAICIPEDLQIIAAPPLPTPTPTLPAGLTWVRMPAQQRAGPMWMEAPLQHHIAIARSSGGDEVRL